MTTRSTMRRWALPGAVFLAAGLFFYDGGDSLGPGDSVRLNGSGERYKVVVAFEDGGYLLQPAEPRSQAGTRFAEPTQVTRDD